jgi:4-hydroxy-2,2'-bipyrrole-5-carbaldehyde O-methyltransferase
MRARTVLALFRQGQLRILFSTMRLAAPFYSLLWLVSASRAGLLRRLAQEPASLDRLASERVHDPADREWLERWLELGVRVGALRFDGFHYALRSRLARGLAEPRHDAVAAILEEIATLHQRLVLESPERLASGKRFALADQDGVLTARSSLLLRPFVHEAIDEVLPRRGALRLLEVGAGSGTYLRYAIERNPELTALGLELQPEVAELANANLRQWGLSARGFVDEGDVRDRNPEPVYDVVTFHNNIYYFPVEERIALLRHALSFLAPGGRVLLTTACSGGSPTAVVLDVWSAGTEGCGRLPMPGELVAQLRAAGYAEAHSRSLVPGDSYHAFFGRRGP